VIQFWWRSGSRFGSGSPKSEIRILQIGGGLCSLSISSLLVVFMLQQAEFAEDEAADDDDDDDQDSVLGVISIINLTYNKVRFIRIMHIIYVS